MYLFVVYFSFAPIITTSIHRYVNYFEIQVLMMVTETETLTSTLHLKKFTYLDYVTFIYIYIYVCVCVCVCMCVCVERERERERDARDVMVTLAGKLTGLIEFLVVAVCISYFAYSFWKGMHLTFRPLPLNKYLFSLQLWVNSRTD